MSVFHTKKMLKSIQNSLLTDSIFSGCDSTKLVSHTSTNEYTSKELCNCLKLIYTWMIWKLMIFSSFYDEETDLVSRNLQSRKTACNVEYPKAGQQDTLGSGFLFLTLKHLNQIENEIYIVHYYSQKKQKRYTNLPTLEVGRKEHRQTFCFVSCVPSVSAPLFNLHTNSALRLVMQSNTPLYSRSYTGWLPVVSCSTEKSNQLKWIESIRDVYTFALI